MAMTAKQKMYNFIKNFTRQIQIETLNDRHNQSSSLNSKSIYRYLRPQNWCHLGTAHWLLCNFQA